MESNPVYNASVSIKEPHSQFPLMNHHSKESEYASTSWHGYHRAKSCSATSSQRTPALDDMEAASFETALESPPSECSEVCDVTFEATKSTLPLRPRYRTVDIGMLREVAENIQLEDILDGCEDVQEEGAPRRPTPMNELICYFKRKPVEFVKPSPAISISTADTSVPNSPVLLPPQSSATEQPPSLDLASQSAEASLARTPSCEQIITEETPAAQQQAPTPCPCDCIAHYLEHDPKIPIKTHPTIQPGGYEEALSLATAELGHWVTVLNRSQSLDTHYKWMGLNYMKRAVMNRLAVPLTFVLEDKNTLVRVHVHTPIGVRHMTGDLTGKATIDHDADCGVWEGVSTVVDYSIPWFCNGTPVRALRQKRVNKKVGVVFETRCILPDPVEGRVMLFNFVMYPYKDPNNPVSIDRILRYVHS